MQTYIAAQPLHNRDLVWRYNPESGQMEEQEYGPVGPGEYIDLPEERAELLIAAGALVGPVGPFDATDESHEEEAS